MQGKSCPSKPSDVSAAKPDGLLWREPRAERIEPSVIFGDYWIKISFVTAAKNDFWMVKTKVGKGELQPMFKRLKHTFYEARQSASLGFNSRRLHHILFSFLRLFLNS